MDTKVSRLSRYTQIREVIRSVSRCSNTNSINYTLQLFTAKNKCIKGIIEIVKYLLKKKRLCIWFCYNKKIIFYKIYLFISRRFL